MTVCCREYLEQQVVDGGLHLQSQAVAGVVLAEGELVVDAEDGDSGDGRAGLRRLLVLLSSLQDFDLQLVQLGPDNEPHTDLKNGLILKSCSNYCIHLKSRHNKKGSGITWVLLPCTGSPYSSWPRLRGRPRPSGAQWLNQSPILEEGMAVIQNMLQMSRSPATTVLKLKLLCFIIFKPVYVAVKTSS